MKNIHAQALGRLGGKSRSKRKAISSKRNGKKGGRPARLGVRSWVDFFNAVDDIRRDENFSSMESLFHSSRRPLEKSLVNATARYLARIGKVNTPHWAEKPLLLKEPYFVSGVENLKASALVESPADYRINNIFVLDNFLDRV